MNHLEYLVQFLDSFLLLKLKNQLLIHKKYNYYFLYLIYITVKYPEIKIHHVHTIHFHKMKQNLRNQNQINNDLIYYKSLFQRVNY
jgi:hypothetical protein